jgi:hypothetical protein
MANTNILYNAAYTGALAGISSRWLTTVAESTYPGVIACCQAFATAIDDELGVVSNAGESDANLLQQICSSFWEDRIPTGDDAADYAPFVPPLCALFTEARAELEPVNTSVAAGALMLCASDATIRNPNLYWYSLAAYEGDDPDAALLCTWNFNGVFDINAVFHARMLPDGRIILLCFRPSPQPGIVIEVPAGESLVDGTPNCRVVLDFASGSPNSICQSQFGEILIGVAIAGPNEAYKLAPELVGWPDTIAANAIIYDDGAIAGEPLGGDDLVCDFDSGLIWSSRYGAGGSAALWDLTGVAGTVVPSVVFSGSNWNGALGVAIAPNGELTIGNYDDDRVNFYAAPYVTGNRAPDRSLTTTSGDTGTSGVLFNARTNELVVLYYDTGGICIFSEAQWLAGGPQTPVRRLNLGLEGLSFGELANGIGVRR